MSTHKVYDLAGIGIGPFNLGMAALLEDRREVEAIFFDETTTFNWHPGLLIEGADLQVPFLADLVTFADPTSRFSFLNYLHTHNRLYTFYFFNRFDIPRREYNDYAQWVANQLTCCRFGKRVTHVTDHPEEAEPYYEMEVLDRDTGRKSYFRAKHIVVGTGSQPMIPEGFDQFPSEDVLHTSEYQYRFDSLQNARSILIAGSGQSAAEVFHHQLEHQERGTPHLYWLTRSPGFFQMESGKLGQEVFSPDYIDYFHKLPFETRQKELPNLSQIRNGVEEQTLHQIYDLLYHRSVQPNETGATIQSNTELKKIVKTDNGYKVVCLQNQEKQEFAVTVDKIILATGYKPHIPDWLWEFKDKIQWEDDKLFAVTRDCRLKFKKDRPHNIYTLTNLEHSHGAGATNLALSVQRNVAIINRIAGREVYPEQRDTVFQSFGVKQMSDKHPDT